MSVDPAVQQKLFVLRVYTSASSPPGSAGGAISDNTDALNADLDRGWNVGSYEVILADAQRGICHVLVRLTTSITAPIAVPPAAPPPAIPPHSKLFVLRTNAGDVDTPYNDQKELSIEIDRGWAIDCYEVILACPGDASCFVLVKLTNTKNKPATPPA